MRVFYKKNSLESNKERKGKEREGKEGTPNARNKKNVCVFINV